MRTPISLFICTLLAATSIHAQVTLAPTVISSGGGYADNDNINIAWTLGELAVTTLIGDNIMLTQGFQQPFDVGVGILPNEIEWGISVYPNPVGDELRIHFNTLKSEDFLVEIQDVTGRTLWQQQHKQIDPGDIVILNTSTFIHGVYFLKVSSPDGQQMQVTSLRKL